MGNNKVPTATYPGFASLMKRKSISVTKLAKKCEVCESTIYRMRTMKPVTRECGDHVAVVINTLPDVHSKTFGEELPITKAKVYLPLNLEHTQLDPDTIGNFRVGNSKPTIKRPIDKTEEEIDRMWAYNAMMGRR